MAHCCVSDLNGDFIVLGMRGWIDVPDGDNFCRLPKLLADNGSQNLTFVCRFNKIFVDVFGKKYIDSIVKLSAVHNQIIHLELGHFGHLEEIVCQSGELSGTKRGAFFHVDHISEKLHELFEDVETFAHFFVKF